MSWTSAARRTAPILPVDGGGFIDIGAGGVATDINLVNGWSHIKAGGSAQGVDFAGFSGRLQVDNPSGLTGTISNFEVGDSIDLFNTSVSSFSFDGSTLTLATNSGSFSYQFTGVQTGTELNVDSDGSGGTIISLELLIQSSASIVPGSGLETTQLPPDQSQPQITLTNV